MHYLAILIAAVCVMSACTNDPGGAGPIEVAIEKTGTGYRLLRGGEPYRVRGAGMGIDDIERFASRGGNSIRTWSTGDDYQATRALLDKAHKYGVSVALGLAMTPERHGFDYDDADAVSARLAAMREEVLKYRDHPAVIAWVIGNELNEGYSNPMVYDAVNQAAEMIHELDPYHLTTTTTAGFKPDVNAEILSRAPALDFISFQMYGSLFGLPGQLEATGFDKPFMVTEWGTIGYWEMETTAWGTPVELTSSEKADKILEAYETVLAPLEERLLGSYVFLWGQKQERTPTWFGLLTEDRHATEAVDAMQYAWTGEWPENRTPRVVALQLDGKGARESVTLQAGETYEAAIEAVDPEGDALLYRWELKPESSATSAGGDFEARIANIDGYLADDAAVTTGLVAPPPGRYRLFVYVEDAHGNVAHANIPFLVEGTFRQAADALIAGELMAVAYSGYRMGQHPDRGDGAINPSEDEILQDLELLADHGFRLIRMYDSGENTRETLRLIRDHDLPIMVLLGIWLRAEISNHLGCPWLDEPIPDQQLAANRDWNAQEVQRGIDLATEFPEIVVSVSVGNEALVDWNDHMVSLDQVIAYVQQVRAAIGQPITVADNYEWWKRDGARLAAELDFVGVHTYPVWENKNVDEALAYTIENIEGVSNALPGRRIAILEAGWATSATEFGARANEADQARYFDELRAWARKANTTVFFFEAFDEPWKGDENDPLGAEKHWGLFRVDRTAKQVVVEKLQ